MTSSDSIVSVARSQVAKHCVETDAWIIFEDKVYDVTSYVDVHPGGTVALLNFAGKDATQAILNQSAHKSIPNFIRKLLAKRLIGQIDDKTVD